MSICREDVLAFLEEQTDLDISEIENDTLLFSSRMVDSFAMVELIQVIETKGNFRMRPTEVHLDNLDSIARILSFSEKRIAEMQGG